MKHFFQIFIFLLFTCFSTSVVFSGSKFLTLKTTPIFQHTENFGKSEKAKIGVKNYVRSSIEASWNQVTNFHQNNFPLSSYLKKGSSCALDFQKTSSQNQFKVAQFS